MLGINPLLVISLPVLSAIQLVFLPLINGLRVSFLLLPFQISQTTCVSLRENSHFLGRLYIRKVTIGWESRGGS